MPATLLELPVPNAAQLVAYYDRLMIFRAVDKSSLSSGWLELTVPANRPHLAADQVIYRFTDPDGAPNYYYAAGYLNSTTGAVSPLSEPVQGAGDPAESVVSIDELKARFLFGLDLRDLKGNPMPDELFAYYRRLAVAWVERRAQIQITQMVVEDERQDFVKPNRRTAPLQLRCHRIPVQSVQSVALEYPYRQPVPFGADAVKLRTNTGKVTIYPVGRTDYGPSPYGAPTFGNMSYFEQLIPNGWRISYVAGFAPGQVPPEIVDAVGKMASLGPLALAGDLLGGVGVASRSLSIDGLSQSLSTVRSGQGGIYGSRIAAYLAEMDKSLPLIRAAYRGIPLQGC